MGRDPYDCLYEGMVPFHNHFRHTFSQIQTILPTTAPASPSPNKISNLSALLNLLNRLCQSLEMHHSIEEAYIFPKLASRLPQFAPSSQHTKEHQLMHTALEDMQREIQRLAKDLKSGKAKSPQELPNFYEYDAMKAKIDHLSSVLLPHLEQEEKSLRADSVKAAGFKLNEIEHLIR